MIRISLISLALTMLAGCVPKPEPKTWTYDQCTRCPPARQP